VRVLLTNTAHNLGERDMIGIRPLCSIVQQDSCFLWNDGLGNVGNHCGDDIADALALCFKENSTLVQIDLGGKVLCSRVSLLPFCCAD
jgi:hypothetical protein